MIIPLLKQRREEERRERKRGEEERMGRVKKSDEVVRTACEEVQTVDINTPIDSITSDCVLAFCLTEIINSVF
jgi:hypothetical protein